MSEPGRQDDEEDDEDDAAESAHDGHAAPGGPYFGRLLIVLFLAVAFCAAMTWILTTTMTD